MMSNPSVWANSIFDRYSNKGLLSAVNNNSSPGESLVCVFPKDTNPSALRFVHNTELRDRARKGQQALSVEPFECWKI